VAVPFDTQKLVDICSQNDVKKIGIFGSMVRGEATDQSDIDVFWFPSVSPRASSA